MKKKSIIIGGTSGVGLETAHYLNECGYDIIVGGRSQCTLPRDIKYKYIDVTKEDTVENFFSSIDSTYINSIIYSAGITVKKKSIEDFSVGEYQKVHNVNLLGAILSLKYAFPLLKKAKGRVVIIGSIASRTYSKFSGFEYTITKSGLSGLVKQLAIEWAKDEILINSVHPSMVETPLLIQNVEKSVLESIENEIAIGRIAKPKEIASAIEFLISEKNTYITGAGIDINGGQYLSG